MRSTINPFQTKTNSNATANPSQTLYQRHTTSNVQPIPHHTGPFASLLSSSKPSVNRQNYTVTFVEMNKSVKTFDGLDHQYTPEEFLHQIDAHMIFNMREQPLEPIDDIQWHKRKMAYIKLFIWNCFELVFRTQ